MRKLNNKGLTAIEVLVCFAIISVIVIAMFNIVNNYKNKQDLESYKSNITTYKNTITKTIYDDIIENKGIISITTTQIDGETIIDPTEAYKENTFAYEIELGYANNKSASITIFNKTRCFEYTKDESTGKKTIGDKNLDCTEDIADNIDNEYSEYYVSFTNSNSETEKFVLPKIYHLMYNDIKAYDDNGMIHIQIGLWHSDFGEKYDALNIITPNVNRYPGML